MPDEGGLGGMSDYGMLGGSAYGAGYYVEDPEHEGMVRVRDILSGGYCFRQWELREEYDQTEPLKGGEGRKHFLEESKHYA